jgi:hypothetical protein
MRFGFRKRGIEMFVALAMMFLAGAAHAQSTTTTEKKTFEILSVRGDVLDVREPEGTRELFVPSDFLFTVDGKSLGVTQLKPGMKGTAKVTKTTMSVPVYVTEVKNVTVTKTMGGTVIVQDADGNFKMFSQGDLDKRGIQVIMDGKPLKFEDMREGDRISANFVSMGPPQTLTKTEVDVTLAKAAAAAPAAAKASGGTAATVTTTTTTESTSVEPAPAAETPDTTVALAPDTTAAPAKGGSSMMWLGLGIVFLILLVLLVLRRRSKS